MSGNRQGVKRRQAQGNQERNKRPPPKPMGNIFLFEKLYIRIHLNIFYFSLLNDKGPCWFCLSSPEVEKHLVVSVGEHVKKYLFI